MKKALVILLVFCMMLSAVACGKPGIEVGNTGEKDETKTQLNVYNFDGGVGTEWLDRAAKEFEAAFADYSFADGKKGVQVTVTPGKKLDINPSNSVYNIFFTERVRYNTLAAQGLLLDISDVVNTSLSDVTGGKESGKIADMLSADTKASLTAIKGNYYVLPHYETYDGIFYDLDVFEEYGLYFLEGGGFCDEDSFSGGVYTGSGKLSVGPDGVRGTADDGLASSYEEFGLLLDRMLTKMVVPFIWTGEYADSYLIKLLNGAWAAYAGADEMKLNFTFGEGAEGDAKKATIVSSIDGTTPVLEEVEISLENGYENSRQAGKYYAMSMLEKVLSNSSYHSKKITEVLSHLNAQEEFIYSNLENAPIAMIIEGSYWYNEAQGAFTRSVNQYKTRAQNRRFAMMQLPRQASGQVTEGNGTKNTLINSLQSFAYVNANIAGDAEKVAASKMFLKFCYSQDQLLKFTVDTGAFRDLNYVIDSSAVAGLDFYNKSMVELRKNSDVVHVMASNSLFVNNQTDFVLEYGSNAYTSTIGSATYMSPYSAMKEGITAKDLFLGGFGNLSDWNKKYSKYLGK